MPGSRSCRARHPGLRSRHRVCADHRPAAWCPQLSADAISGFELGSGHGRLACQPLALIRDERTLDHDEWLEQIRPPFQALIIDNDLGRRVEPVKRKDASNDPCVSHMQDIGLGQRVRVPRPKPTSRLMQLIGVHVVEVSDPTFPIHPRLTEPNNDAFFGGINDPSGSETGSQAGKLCRRVVSNHSSPVQPISPGRCQPRVPSELCLRQSEAIERRFGGNDGICVFHDDPLRCAAHNVVCTLTAGIHPHEAG